MYRYDHAEYNFDILELQLPRIL